MQKIIHYIFVGFSLLPLKVLYYFSDIIFFIIYYVIRYRKKIIINNIAHSLPEKSIEEQKKIAKRFYRDFSDYLMESLKGLTISEKELKRRMKFVNIELLEEQNEDRNIATLSGHVFNFEWLMSIVCHAKKFNGFYYIYKPVENKYLDQQIKNVREKFGAKGISSKSTREIFQIPNDGKQILYFLSDQSPKKGHKGYSLKFLSQETPVFTGYENIIKKYNQIPIYVDILKVKRGYYKAIFHRIYPRNGIQFEKNEIVHQFFDYLEQTIKKNPDNWLWSHRRWK